MTDAHESPDQTFPCRHPYDCEHCAPAEDVQGALLAGIEAERVRIVRIIQRERDEWATVLHTSELFKSTPGAGEFAAKTSVDVLDGLLRDIKAGER